MKFKFEAECVFTVTGFVEAADEEAACQLFDDKFELAVFDAHTGKPHGSGKEIPYPEAVGVYDPEKLGAAGFDVLSLEIENDVYLSECSLEVEDGEE